MLHNHLQHKIQMIKVLSGQPIYNDPKHSHTPTYSDEVRKTNLSRRQKPSSPAFDLLNTDIESRTDNTTLVQPPIEFNHNLSSSVVINILKLANIT